MTGKARGSGERRVGTTVARARAARTPRSPSGDLSRASYLSFSLISCLSFSSAYRSTTSANSTLSVCVKGKMGKDKRKDYFTISIRLFQFFPFSSLHITFTGNCWKNMKISWIVIYFTTMHFARNPVSFSRAKGRWPKTMKQFADRKSLFQLPPLMTGAYFFCLAWK